MRSLQGKEHRPGQEAQRAECRSRPRAQGLAGERAGRNLTERAGGAAGQAASPRWGPAAPILQLSDKTYFLDPEGPENAVQELEDGGGDAPAPAGT